MTRWLLPVSLAIGGGAGLLWWQPWKPKPKPPPPPPPPIEITVDVDVPLPALIEARAGDTLHLVNLDPLSSVAEVDALGTPLPYDALLTGPDYLQPAGLYVYVPNSSSDTPLPDAWTWPEAAGLLIEYEPARLCPTQAGCNFEEVGADLDAAFAHGKVISVGMRWGRQGTPSWYDDAGASLLTFTQTSDGDPPTDGTCGLKGSIGSPMDPVFLALVIDHWRELGAWARANGKRYQAIGGVEGVGLAWQTIEARLPDGCAAAPCPCSLQTWTAAGYTAQDAIDFMATVLEVMAEEFPGKSVRYSLIQAGFPGDGTTETTAIVGKGTAAGIAEVAIGGQWLPKHNGVRPGQLPNRWVMDAGIRGQRTGYQTTNSTNGVATGADLRAAIANVLTSDVEALFVEGYQDLFADARLNGQLDTYAQQFKARDSYPTTLSVVLPAGDRWFTVSGRDGIVHVAVK